MFFLPDTIFLRNNNLFFICQPPTPGTRPLEIIPHAREEAMVLFQRLYIRELKQRRQQRQQKRPLKSEFRLFTKTKRKWLSVCSRPP